MRLNNLLRFFILFCISIAGCTNTNSTTPVKSFSTQTSTPITKTPIPPIHTIAPTSTPTIIPTLSVDDARKRLLDLLANNGGCRLPCLWGIIPRKSTVQEAQAILSPLTSISEPAITGFDRNSGAVFLSYTDGDLILDTSAGFLSENQIVSHIAFQARELKKVDNGFIEVFDSSFFNKYLGYYMLSNVLTKYGNPTTVLLSTMAKLPSSGVPGGFKVLLLYPDQGILVNYTMQMQISSKDIMGCPSNAHMELELYHLGYADSFFDLLEPSGWTQIIQKTYKPIGNVTSMSQDDFYRIFSQPTDKCILTPASLWPTPD